MQMVAASKLKGAQSRVEHARPYALALREVIGRLSSYALDASEGYEKPLHPFLKIPKEDAPKLFVVLASDRGLCGAFNANLLRFAHAQVATERRQDQDVQVYAVGKKTLDYFQRRGVSIAKRYLGATGSPSYASAQSMVDEIVELFTSGQFSGVELVFTRFRSIASHVPSRVRLLPIGGVEKEAVAQEGAPKWEYMFEPDRDGVLGALLPRYVTVVLFQALLESSASEHAARMMAMENANKNAKEMIERLTLEFNKTRQATITKELTEIVGGKEALEG
jgi:F-type H+-transporting ATPase subunit gamma